MKLPDIGIPWISPLTKVKLSLAQKLVGIYGRCNRVHNKIVVIGTNGRHYRSASRWVRVASASLVAHISWLAESQKDRYYSTHQSQGVLSLSTPSGPIEADPAVGWDLLQAPWIWTSHFLFWGHRYHNPICSLITTTPFPLSGFSITMLWFLFSSFKILYFSRSAIAGR